jgi:ribonuclease HII
MLKSYFEKNKIEAGCDEAGRGCLAGPVCAAAVILPHNFKHPSLNDSKQITKNKRDELRLIIETKAIAFGVAFVDHARIDEINILNASFEAMHLALSKLKKIPNSILVDGNRFKKYQEINHHCIVKGDAKYMSIAAASILAKTYRDEYMTEMAKKYPGYDWQNNKGYPTKKHREGIQKLGPTAIHRMSFQLKKKQLELDLK